MPPGTHSVPYEAEVLEASRPPPTGSAGLGPRAFLTHTPAWGMSPASAALAAWQRGGKLADASHQL